MHSEINERELARLCSEKDRKAQDLLYTRYAASLLTLCRRYTHDEDEAMDLMIDSLVKALDKISTFNYRGEGSLYSSSSSNPYFRSKQKVQYLGIPLKLNFSIARNERLDVYLGAGGAAEFCTSAKIDGKDISRDGPGFSFLGAVGVQFNLTDSFGLYLEPELSRAVSSSKAVLSTYRSEHPTMFSIASGVRITLH